MGTENKSDNYFNGRFGKAVSATQNGINKMFRFKKKRSPGIPHIYKGRIKGCKRHRVLYFMEAKTARIAQF